MGAATPTKTALMGAATPMKTALMGAATPTKTALMGAATPTKTALMGAATPTMGAATPTKSAMMGATTPTKNCHMGATTPTKTVAFYTLKTKTLTHNTMYDIDIDNMAAIPPLFTVHDTMVICGINNATLFQGRTQAERIAYEIFSADFSTTMDISIDELNDELKTLAGMTAAQGQIRLMPGIKKNIRAFIQWCRDEFCMGRDPATVPFPVIDASQLLRRMKTHEQYVYGSKLMSQQALPQDFTNDVQWDDWHPTFVNYLRTIPGRDGVPLQYVVRTNEQSISSDIPS
ncbi:unnamed protein product [Cylindrotheca closterium]|uniref:Uncharacterized protein n=1 Tax=Cylindrotheca closterium TaxID=2856 RepID=A0AAD2CTP8_9STRA|nr:unnamed protein product [Cylindrotheca closterium]